MIKYITRAFSFAITDYKKNNIWFALIVLTSLFLCSFSFASTAPPQKTNIINTGLHLDINGNLTLNGKPYRGIGVNYFSAFTRNLDNPNDVSYIEGFKYLNSVKIPFIRFSANGYWPSGYKLYLTNKPKYFRLLDNFVRAAELNHIGLIPSLFWNPTTVCDVVGEHMDQWGNPNSKTIAFMRKYVNEVTSRYKNSKAIWGWEFGNEMNSFADLLSQSIRFLPSTSMAQGTPLIRTFQDIMSTKILRSALIEFTKSVKLNDPYHILFSGNVLPPPNAYHRYAKQKWDIDSVQQYTYILDQQNPPALGTITIHVYPDNIDKHFADYKNKVNYYQVIHESMLSSKSLKRVLFVGEFGSPKTLGDEQAKEKFSEVLNAIVDNKVPLSALWVFDFPYQNSDWNVTPSNNRKYQLDLVANANNEIRKELGF